jgi:hypothetical protein
VARLVNCEARLRKYKEKCLQTQAALAVAREKSGHLVPIGFEFFAEWREGATAFRGSVAIATSLPCVFGELRRGSGGSRIDQ